MALNARRGSPGACDAASAANCHDRLTAHAVELFVRREDAERSVGEVQADDEGLAGTLAGLEAVTWTHNGGGSPPFGPSMVNTGSENRPTSPGGEPCLYKRRHTCLQ